MRLSTILILLILAIVIVSETHAESTECYRLGDSLYCDTTESAFDRADREKARRRQAEHYQRMEELAEQAAAAAEERNYE